MVYMALHRWRSAFSRRLRAVPASRPCRAVIRTACRPYAPPAFFARTPPRCVYALYQRAPSPSSFAHRPSWHADAAPVDIANARCRARRPPPAITPFVTQRVEILKATYPRRSAASDLPALLYTRAIRQRSPADYAADIAAASPPTPSFSGRPREHRGEGMAALRSVALRARGAYGRCCRCRLSSALFSSSYAMKYSSARRPLGTTRLSISADNTSRTTIENTGR